jgi:hypothetical protein
MEADDDVFAVNAGDAAVVVHEPPANLNLKRPSRGGRGAAMTSQMTTACAAHQQQRRIKPMKWKRISSLFDKHVRRSTCLIN